MSFECDVCADEYDLANRRPVVGNCGHTFCFLCSRKFANFQCPTCRKMMAFHDPPTNFDLLSRINAERQGQNQPSSSQVHQSGRSDRHNYSVIDIEGPLMPRTSSDDFRAQNVQQVRGGLIQTQPNAQAPFPRRDGQRYDSDPMLDVTFDECCTSWMDVALVFLEFSFVIMVLGIKLIIKTISFECEICFEEYDLANRRPVFGNCGHTFCFLCSQHFANYQCPTCRKDMAFNDPPTNFDLLSRMDSARQEKPQSSFAQPHQPGSSGQRNHTVIDIEGPTMPRTSTNNSRPQNVPQVRQGSRAQSNQNNYNTRNPNRRISRNSTNNFRAENAQPVRHVIPTPSVQINRNVQIPIQIVPRTGTNEVRAENVQRVREWINAQSGQHNRVAQNPVPQQSIHRVDPIQNVQQVREGIPASRIQNQPNAQNPVPQQPIHGDSGTSWTFDCNGCWTTCYECLPSCADVMEIGGLIAITLCYSAVALIVLGWAILIIYAFIEYFPWWIVVALLAAAYHALIWLLKCLFYPFKLCFNSVFGV